MASWCRWVAAVCAALALAPGAQAAEGEGPGQIVAFACGTVPERARIDVQTFDDAPAEAALREAIARELGRKGYTVAVDAPLRLTFDGGIERALDARREARLGELQKSNNEVTMRLNMWSSSGDSVLGGVKRAGPSGSDPSVYRLLVFVHDKANGRCLWQGEAAHPVEGQNEDVTARRLVPVALRRLGQTVQPTPFAFDD
jgi:hypothetical protein